MDVCLCGYVAESMNGLSYTFIKTRQTSTTRRFSEVRDYHQ